MLSWPSKDPDELLDYQVSWVKGLAGDTILTSTFIVPDGLVKDSEENTSNTATVWLSGGTLGESYIVVNRITTVTGRIMDQSVRLRVLAK